LIDVKQSASPYACLDQELRHFLNDFEDSG